MVFPASLLFLLTVDGNTLVKKLFSSLLLQARRTRCLSLMCLQSSFTPAFVFKFFLDLNGLLLTINSRAFPVKQAFSTAEHLNMKLSTENMFRDRVAEAFKTKNFLKLLKALRLSRLFLSIRLPSSGSRRSGSSRSCPMLPPLYHPDQTSCPRILYGGFPFSR